MTATVKRGFVGGVPTVYWASCEECSWWSDNGANYCRSEDEARRKADRHNSRKHPKQKENDDEPS